MPGRFSVDRVSPFEPCVVRRCRHQSRKVLERVTRARRARCNGGAGQRRRATSRELVDQWRGDRLKSITRRGDRYLVRIEVDGVPVQVRELLEGESREKRGNREPSIRSGGIPHCTYFLDRELANVSGRWR